MTSAYLLKKQAMPAGPEGRQKALYTTQKTEGRIQGYDFARGIAVFGMFFMNFKLVMQPPVKMAHGFWPVFWQAWEGRFAILFVMLAGIGISLMTSRERQARAMGLPGSRTRLKAKRRILFKRALFLFVTGLIFSSVWPADILHFYGIYMVAALAVLTGSHRDLISLIWLSGLVFLALFVFLNWEQNWDWASLTYQNFWTIKGFLLNTFFNGFHPFFPWFGFLLSGMLIGRLDLTNPRTQMRCLIAAGATALAVESLAYGLVPFWGNPWKGFFLTLAFPPLPLFMISGACTSLVIIILSMKAARKLPQALTRPIVRTGQMVLTHYIAHVLIAMVVLESMGLLYNRSLAEAFWVSAGTFALSVLFSVVWLEHHDKGPMETLMRRIAG